MTAGDRRQDDSTKGQERGRTSPDLEMRIVRFCNRKYPN